jgi:hypothetical protein
MSVHFAASPALLWEDNGAGEEDIADTRTSHSAVTLVGCIGLALGIVRLAFAGPDQRQ